VDLDESDEFLTTFDLIFSFFNSPVCRAEKEKAKFQSEVYELLSSVESITKEKVTCVKTIEKLEISITELNVRIEELNRTILDITSHKTRLSQENIELVREVQDLKVNIESVLFSKSQIISQLEDARRRIEDDDRRRSHLESSLHSVETELETIRIQLEEESEARLDLERQLVKSTGECANWKVRFESEASARAEEVEEIRRKYTCRIQEQEEHIESLLVKVNNLEKIKSRLSSEIEVLIIDLEKANGIARDMQKRVEVLERTNVELKVRLEETLQLYEQSQRDIRTKQAEITRVVHELDKTREQKDQLLRENKKLGGEFVLNQFSTSLLSETTIGTYR
jgi:chromosome segregation ATPase